MSPKHSTLTSYVPVLLALALLSLAAVLAARGRQIERWFGAEVSSTQPGLDPNPHYREMSELAARHGVSLEHARTLRRGRSFDIRESPLFLLPDRSLDVLIVGDSTVVWGFSPLIVSRASGQRVGVFAYGQARPTRNFLRTVRSLARRYLTDEGLILLCFSSRDWSQPQNARQVDRNLQALTQMGERELEAFIQNKRSLVPAPFTPGHVAAHWKGVEESLAKIPWLGAASLPELSFYSRWAEPVVAPRTAAAALENTDQRGKQVFYHWDDWKSILLLCPTCSYEAPRRVPPRSRRPDREMLSAAEAASSLPHELGFVITFYGVSSLSGRLRGLYEMALEERAALVDLEAMWPLELAVAVQSGVHVANEGALYQSLLLARWLQRYSNGEPDPNRRAPL